MYSRNARPMNALIGRAHWEISQAPLTQHSRIIYKVMDTSTPLQ